MNPQFINRRYWMNAAACFLIYLPLDFFINYVTGLDSFEWTFIDVARKIGSAIFFAAFFGYRFGKQIVEPAQKNDAPAKPGAKDLVTAMVKLSVILIPVSLLTLLLTWILFFWSRIPDANFLNTSLKHCLSLEVMLILFNLVFLVLRRWEYNRYQKSIFHS